jgi:hypothetical protein
MLPLVVLAQKAPNLYRLKQIIVKLELYLEPILRLQNLQLQRQCCSRLERFFAFKMH